MKLRKNAVSVIPGADVWEPGKDVTSFGYLQVPPPGFEICKPIKRDETIDHANTNIIYFRSLITELEL